MKHYAAPTRCEPRIEVVVKMQKKIGEMWGGVRSGWLGSGRRVESQGGCEPGIEVKKSRVRVDMS